MQLSDHEIVELYWQRDESAIQMTEAKYDAYLNKIARNVLASLEDVAEVVNDSYLRAWMTMPDQRPEKLSLYLGRITRGLAIDRYRHNHSKKRFTGESDCSLEELTDFISSPETAEAHCEMEELTRVINDFLKNLPREQADLFLCRYYYMDSIEAIAGYTGFSISKIKSVLHRLRKRLKTELEREGYVV